MSAPGKTRRSMNPVSPRASLAVIRAVLASRDKYPPSVEPFGLS